MVAGRQYREEELKQSVGMAANILKGKVYDEQVAKALAAGIIMKSHDPFGKVCYLRPVVQTELDFNVPSQ